MKIYKVTAKSIGDQLDKMLLAGPENGKIYSVYANVINIEVGGILVSLAKSKIGNGSYTVLLPPLAEPFNQWEFKVGDPVYFTRTSIELKKVKIELKWAKVWSSTWQNKPEPERFFPVLPQLKDLVLREGNLKGLGILLQNERDDTNLSSIQYVQQTLVDEAIPLVTQLLEGLFMGTKDFWFAASELAGLGPGLTPAGDSFLIGVLLTCRYLESGGFLQLPEFKQADFIEKVKQATNLLGATGILLATKGRPYELVRDLLEHLFSGKKVHTILSALRLIDQGNTSGTDVLTGIILAGEVFQRKYLLNSEGKY